MFCDFHGDSLLLFIHFEFYAIMQIILLDNIIVYTYSGALAAKLLFLKKFPEKHIMIEVHFHVCSVLWRSVGTISWRIKVQILLSNLNSTSFYLCYFQNSDAFLFRVAFLIVILIFYHYSFELFILNMFSFTPIFDFHIISSLVPCGASRVLELELVFGDQLTP